MVDLQLCSLCEDKTIAIVGNAQSLLDLNKAQEIDSHDVVVRMNKSVLADVAIRDAHSGHKCTIYTASGVGCVPIENHKTNTPTLSYWMTTRLREKAPKDFLFFPEDMWHQLQIELCGGKKLDARPSTGIMVIYMILMGTKYRQVDIYGFDFWKSKTFYNPTLSVAATHKPDYEEVLVQKLLKNFKNVNLVGV